MNQDLRQETHKFAKYVFAWNGSEGIGDEQKVKVDSGLEDQLLAMNLSSTSIYRKKCSYKYTTSIYSVFKLNSF